MLLKVLLPVGRVHGEVSREPAVWEEIPVVHQEALREVKYAKSQGEGIAKVGEHRLAKRCASDVAPSQ